MASNGTGPRGPAAEREPIKVLVLGNQNTGKSALVERLARGKLDEIALPSGARVQRGRCGVGDGADGVARRILGRRDRAGQAVIYDTPGTATLVPQGEDEAVARDALLALEPTVLLLVVDAKNVRRSLALTLHAAELGLPMVVALNMDDEATRRGIGVDAGLLARTFGVDVVPTVAPEGKGLDRLREALGAARVPRSGLTFEEHVATAIAELEALFTAGGVAGTMSARGAAVLSVGDDPIAFEAAGARLDEPHRAAARAVLARARAEVRRPLDIVLTDALYERAEKLAAEAIRTEPARRGLLDRVGELAEHRLWGLVVAGAVVVAMYFWVGKLGASIVVDALDEHVFRGWLTPLAQRLVAPIPWPIVRDAVMDPDFGLLPTGLFLAFGIVLPVLVFFFFAFGVLQNSGYLARLSVLLDRSFRSVGLNGRAVMSLVMGFSCVTMALITTRMLDTRRERLVASALILGLPCAPLLAVMMLVLAELPPSAAVIVFGVLVAQKLAAGVVVSRLVPGESSDFIMVIPPLRRPRLRPVLGQTARQTYAFMREAVPFFLLASLLLFAFDRVGGLAALERAAHPITSGLLQLPDEAVQVFVKSIVRRESGAAELVLVRARFTNVQLVVTLIVLASIVPCVNAAIVLVKERGVREAALTIAGVTAYSLAVGGLVSHLFSALGVTLQ
jgi:ferrous iron transport protein B